MIQQMKEWLGDGEYDIDLMIRMGTLTEARVVEFCTTLTDSPWYQYAL
jgi:hypothetical protein